MRQLTTLSSLHDPNAPSSEVLTAEQEEAAASLDAKVRSGEMAMESVPCLCGESERLHLLATYDRYRIWQPTVICQACGLVQSRPRMAAHELPGFYSSDDYRRLYSGDRHLRQTPEQFLAMARGNDQRRKLIMGAVPDLPVGTVAEIGCGAGWNLHGFHGAGWRAIGCDFSPALTDIGQGMGLDLRQGPAEVLAGERSDLLILSHVVEHLPDPVAEVAQWVAMLHPRYVYIEVPNAEDFCVGMLQSAHLYYFTPPTLRAYMARAGLRPVAAFPRGCHFAVLFEPAAEPVAPALDGEFSRMMAIVKAFERRERIKGALDACGALPLARRLLRLLRRP